MTATRRLAAILAADVVGYSRLMGEDEAGTARAMRAAKAKAALARLIKAMPRFTVQLWANVKSSDDPTFECEYQRIVEGLRKAGLPEQ